MQLTDLRRDADAYKQTTPTYIVLPTSDETKETRPRIIRLSFFAPEKGRTNNVFLKAKCLIHVASGATTKGCEGIKVMRLLDQRLGEDKVRVKLIQSCNFNTNIACLSFSFHGWTGTKNGVQKRDIHRLSQNFEVHVQFSMFHL